MLITNLLRLSGDPCDRKRDAVSDRNVLVYQSLDNGSVYAIDVDRNVTHLVVDSNVVVRLYCIVCQFSNDIRLTDKRAMCPPGFLCSSVLYLSSLVAIVCTALSVHHRGIRFMTQRTVTSTATIKTYSV